MTVLCAAHLSLLGLLIVWHFPRSYSLLATFPTSPERSPAFTHKDPDRSILLILPRTDLASLSLCQRARPHKFTPPLLGKNDGVEGSKSESDLNPVTKASWYAVEAFGKAFGVAGAKSGSTMDAATDLSRPPASLEEALRRIELDNERSYFLSGEVDVMAYDENCVFADPFVSFSGRDRFVENLANLGSFITNYDAKMLKYEVEDEGTVVKTKLMVKLELNLPWKPVLAWPWGVTYSIDPDTCLITDHVESWDIAPWEGVKQIFRAPTANIKARK